MNVNYRNDHKNSYCYVIVWRRSTMKYGIWLFTGEHGGYGWLSAIGDWIKAITSLSDNNFPPSLPPTQVDMQHQQKSSLGMSSLAHPHEGIILGWGCYDSIVSARITAHRQHLGGRRQTHYSRPVALTGLESSRRTLSRRTITRRIVMD